MEDLRKEKREKSFFSLPDFQIVKKRRENFLVSLRKKKKQEKFTEARLLRRAQNTYNEIYEIGLIDYKDPSIQFEKDLEYLKLDDRYCTADNRFEALITKFIESEDVQTTVRWVRIFRIILSDSEFINDDNKYVESMLQMDMLK